MNHSDYMSQGILICQRVTLLTLANDSNNSVIDLDQYILDPSVNYFKCTKMHDVDTMVKLEQIRKFAQEGELNNLFEDRQAEGISQRWSKHEYHQKQQWR